MSDIVQNQNWTRAIHDSVESYIQIQDSGIKWSLKDVFFNVSFSVTNTFIVLLQNK
jgi:hypothetical protein